MRDEPGETTDARAHRQSVLADISRQMVGLYKGQFGRGPTRSSTNFAGPNIVICTLEDTLTPAERKLADLGEQGRLRDIRMFFQEVTRDEFVAIIENALGRKVRGFVSGIDTTVDISSEVFYLEPAPVPTRS